MNEQHRYNKDLALRFYKDVIGRRDAARSREIIAEGYIQHNPHLKTGRAGVLEALEHLRKMPPPAEAPSPIKLVIADADLAALLLVVELGGQKKVVVDIFRVAGGQLAEHRDAVQNEAESGSPDGSTRASICVLKFFSYSLNKKTGYVPVFCCFITLS